MLTFVDSIDDPRVADFRHVANPGALQRAGLFVAEGRWVVERLLARPQFHTRAILATPTAYAAVQRNVAAHLLDAIPTFVVDQQQMDRIAGFNIHRGCLALAERPAMPRLETVAIAGATLLIVLEGVNNPDNIGGVFRSAAAFDADLVVLGPASGDPLYRKAIRTSMASTLDVPYAAAGEWPGSIDLLRAAGFCMVALTPDAEATPLTQLANHPRVALMLGSEGHGLSAAALERANLRVRIETTRRVDSLNVAVAASIALHHLYASRR